MILALLLNALARYMERFDFRARFLSFKLFYLSVLVFRV